MAEEDNQRTIGDDDDDEEKESETETEGDESEPDASENPSKIEEARGTRTASASANPSMSIPVLSLDRSTDSNQDGRGNGSGNGKAELVEPVSSLSLSLGDNQSQKRAEREELMGAASRRLFQRLWTDEEEIRILRGFLEFTQRRGTTFASHQYDTGPFYEEIRQQLHLDFSKNQLIEKLRRLKKKYRNCAARMRSKGPAFSFRSSHEQNIYDIARHIWRPANKRQAEGLPDSSRVDLDLDLAVDQHPSASAPSEELDFSFSVSFPPSKAAHQDLSLNPDPAKPHSRSSSRRARRRVQQDSLPPPPPSLPPAVTVAIPVSVSPPPPWEAPTVVAPTNSVPPPIVPSLSSGDAFEDTVRSCLSPLFKELVSSAIGRGGSSLGMFGLGPIPTCPPGKSGDDKWRRQHILELEVYLQRIELVKQQVMQTLQDLKRSTN